VNVFVFVVKEAFDSPCFPQDYKDEIEVSELVQFLEKTSLPVIGYNSHSRHILGVHANIITAATKSYTGVISARLPNTQPSHFHVIE